VDVGITINRFKRHLTALGYADNTIDIYQRNLDQFQRYLDSRNITDLRQVTRSVMLDYQETLSNDKTAPETKASKIRSVKRFFEYLVDENKLLINPSEGMVEVSRKNRKIGTVLTITEINKLLDQPDTSLAGLRNRAVMEVLYSTGVRIDELIHLEIKDLNREDGTLYIRKAKGGNERIIPIGKRALKHVDRYLDQLSDGRPDRIFINRSGKPLTDNTVRVFLNKYRHQAGIKKNVSPHTFRRTCATHLLQNGADIRYIQKLLGHKDLRTTQVYTKVMPVEVKETHEKTHPNVRGETWTSKKK